MNEISLVKKEVQKEKWMQIISECQQSGLTVNEWCQENGIGVKNYYYHLRKLRTEMCKQVAVPITDLSEEEVNASVSTATIRCGEISVEVNENVRGEFLISLMKAFKC